MCVPIDPKECDAFDPQAVPTVETLLAEIDQHDKRQSPEASRSSSPVDAAAAAVAAARKGHATAQYEKTSLRPYVRLFEKTVLVPLRQLGRAAAADGDGSTSPMRTDDSDW